MTDGDSWLDDPSWPWLDDPRLCREDPRWPEVLEDQRAAGLSADHGCASDHIANRVFGSVPPRWRQPPPELLDTLFNRSRTVVFVGDSLLQQQYRSLVCVLLSDRSTARLPEAPISPSCDCSSSMWSRGGRRLHVCLLCSAHFLGRAAVVGQQRSGNGSEAGEVEQKLSAALLPQPLIGHGEDESTGTDLLVLVGVGAHYNHHSTASSRSIAQYERELADLPRWWNPLRRRWLEARSGRASAELLIQEPLPQHFDNPPALGLYDPAVLRANAIKGALRSNHAAPSINSTRSGACGVRRSCAMLESQKCTAHTGASDGVHDRRWAAFASAVPAGIRVSRVHSLASPLWFAHRGWDCTHFCASAVYLWNVELGRQMRRAAPAGEGW